MLTEAVLIVYSGTQVWPMGIWLNYLITDLAQNE